MKKLLEDKNHIELHEPLTRFIVNSSRDGKIILQDLIIEWSRKILNDADIKSFLETYPFEMNDEVEENIKSAVSNLSIPSIVY